MSKSHVLYEPVLKETNGTGSKTKVLAGADGLRALACLGVIFHHFSQHLGMPFQRSLVQEIQSFFLLGNSGVSVFFVLSGFLLSYQFWKQYLNEGHFPDMKKYAIRRAGRIIPGFYASLLVSTVLVIIFHVPVKYFLVRILGGLTFTAGFHYITLFPNEINGPFWSISFEVFCYFLMPAFMFGLFKILGKKRSFMKAFVYWIGVFAVIILLNQLIHVFLTPDDYMRGWEYGLVGGAKVWMPNYNPVGFFGHFILGIMAAGVSVQLFRKAHSYEKFKRNNGFDFMGMAFFVGSIALLWLMRHQPEYSLGLQNQPYFFPVYAMLIAGTLAVTSQANWFGKLLDNKFFRFTAKVSFGLYIWHYLVIFIVTKLWVKDYEKFMGIADIKLWGLVSLCMLILSYCVAALSYKFIEKPVLDRAHKINFKR